MGSKYGEFRVFKYHLPVVRKINPIQMPADAKVLSTACQGREVYIWALVNVQEPLRVGLFAFFCTGDEIPAEMVLRHHPKFIGTAVTEKGGDYPGGEVLHVFEVDASD